MTRLTAVLRRVMTALLPWPARHVRRAAIDSARGEKERSRAAAAKAARLTRQIEQMAAENHFASAITRDIIARHRGERA